MPRTCSVCNHSKREEIDSGLIAAVSFRDLARQFVVSASSLFRHRKVCIAQLLATTRDATALLAGESLIQQVAQLQQTVAKVIQTAERERNPGIVLAGVSKLERLLEFHAKLTGELKPAQVNVVNVPVVEEATLVKMARFFLESREDE